MQKLSSDSTPGYSGKEKLKNRADSNLAGMMIFIMTIAFFVAIGCLAAGFGWYFLFKR